MRNRYVYIELKMKKFLGLRDTAVALHFCVIRCNVLFVCLFCFYCNSAALRWTQTIKTGMLLYYRTAWCGRVTTHRCNGDTIAIATPQARKCRPNPEGNATPVRWYTEYGWLPRDRIVIHVLTLVRRRVVLSRCQLLVTESVCAASTQVHSRRTRQTTEDRHCSTWQGVNK